jgi:hypothetical protein
VKELLGRIAVFLFGTAHAQIYNNQTTLPPFALANSLAGNNAGASTTMQFGVLNVFDVRNYGAACNGTTDDHAAWQSAINSAAALAHFSGSPLPAKIVGCQTGQSLITTTLNFTGFSSFGTPYALALIDQLEFAATGFGSGLRSTSPMRLRLRRRTAFPASR